MESLAIDEQRNIQRLAYGAASVNDTEESSPDTLKMLCLAELADRGQLTKSLVRQKITMNVPPEMILLDKIDTLKLKRSNKWSLFGSIISPLHCSEREIVINSDFIRTRSCREKICKRIA